MKKIAIMNVLVVLAVVISLISLFALRPATQEEENSFQQILDQRHINACYTPWPPALVKNSTTEELSGFFVDIFNEAMSQAHIKVDFVESTWSTFPADLAVGRCDVAMTGIFPSIERSTSVAFTRPFLYTTNTLAMRADDSRFPTLDDINQESVRIAVVQGSYGHTNAIKLFPKAQLIVLPPTLDMAMTMVAVSNNNADLAYVSYHDAEAYIKQQGDIAMIFDGDPLDAISSTWAVRQGDLDLLNFLDNALDYLEVTGYTKATMKRYNAPGWFIEERTYSPVFS